MPEDPDRQAQIEAFLARKRADGRSISPENRVRIDALDDACATGTPPGQRKVSKRKRRGDQIKIAAALGKGGAIREVAEEVGLSKTMVQFVKDKIDKGKDRYLAEVRQRAQDELSTAAIDALRPTIAAMKAKIDDKDTRLSDMAQSARALNEIAFPAQEQAPLRVPLGDMAKMSGTIAAELLLQLKAHEEKTARPEIEVDGERIK